MSVFDWFRRPAPIPYEHEGLPDLLTAIRRVTDRYGRTGQTTQEELCDLCAVFDREAEELLERAMRPSTASQPAPDRAS